MKRVRFHEETQTFTPVMQGHMHCIKKEPLSSEEEVEQRRSPFQTKRQRQRDLLRHSYALRKAGHSEAKRRKKQKRLDRANAAWLPPPQDPDPDPDIDTDTVVVVVVVEN